MSPQPPASGDGSDTGAKHVLGNGRYEIGGLLGRGGMADVHSAQDVRLGRTVAIKRLRVDLAADPTFQARFRREAQSAASLNHPAIVAVYDTGEEPDPNGTGVVLPYIVMELAEGRTLRDILREGRKILPERALEITASVLSALDYSHRAGIVHRDIKPANVMLTPTGEIKVMDFGIARAIADSSATMTATAAVVGTAQYLSPEQARGEQVDARSDLYSTGCLLFELLTGRPPFIGDSPVSVAYQHVREEPSPPSFYESTVSPEVDAVTLKALTKPVDERYQSASEMRADIERCLAGRPVLAPAVLGAAAVETQAHFLGHPPAGDAQPTAVSPQGASAYENEPPARSRNWVWILVGVLAVVVAILAALLLPRLLGDSNTSKQVDVPDVIGKTVPQANAALERVGLHLGGQTPAFSTTVPKGEIVSQEPARLERVAEGSAVDVRVSAGAETHPVPDVTPYFLKDATRRLEALDFQVNPIKVLDSPLRFGKVIRTDPSAGTVQPVGTTIDVYYSSGFIPVPNVVGESQKAAMADLRREHFVPLPSSEASDAPAGTVVRQEPEALTPRPFGSTVVIFVSLGPTTPPTTPTTTTPPTTPTTSPTTSTTSTTPTTPTSPPTPTTPSPPTSPTSPTTPTGTTTTKPVR
ncbi:MAG: Stk1 family PASTA domain-containing Ser/Thr kinase [Nocardioidaceae bacterium]